MAIISKCKKQSANHMVRADTSRPRRVQLPRQPDRRFSRAHHEPATCGGGADNLHLGGATVVNQRAGVRDGSRLGTNRRVKLGAVQVHTAFLHRDIRTLTGTTQDVYVSSRPKGAEENGGQCHKISFAL